MQKYNKSSKKQEHIKILHHPPLSYRDLIAVLKSKTVWRPTNLCKNLFPIAPSFSQAQWLSVYYELHIRINMIIYKKHAHYTF